RCAAHQPPGCVTPPPPAQGRGDGRRAGRRDAAHLPPRTAGRRGGAGLPGCRLGRGRRPVPPGGREHAPTAMSEPLRLSFDVACDARHAFVTWTRRIAMWWPADHTVSGSPDSVVFEGRVGGRIYERAAHGEELDWGVVTVWRPPELVAYRWHLGVDVDR